MNTTPAMCHQAEIVFRAAVIETANRFTRIAIAITTE